MASEMFVVLLSLSALFFAILFTIQKTVDPYVPPLPPPPMTPPGHSNMTLILTVSSAAVLVSTGFMVYIYRTRANRGNGHAVANGQ